MRETKLKTCGLCSLYHHGCEFSETETTDNNVKDFVACGQFVPKECTTCAKHDHYNGCTDIECNPATHSRYRRGGD